MVIVYQNGVMTPVLRADAANPLYDNGDYISSIRENMIKDFLFEKALDLNHSNLSDRKGVTMKNMNGKDVVFKKEPFGEFILKSSYFYHSS